MTNLKQCCTNEPQFIIAYNTNTVYLVCSVHSKKFEYEVGISKIFDYKTKKELSSIEGIFNE